jgi:hypothetical protein
MTAAAKPPGLPFDPHTPKPARIYDYWRGGHNNYDADRRRADEIERLYPAVRKMAADNTGFAGRAVTWAALNGIRCFVDLGAGLLTGECIHRTARTVIPGARVVYVDYDLEVTNEAEMILDKDGHDGVAVIRADLRDPAAVLAEPGLREVVAGYVRGVAPGSVVVISVPRDDDPRLFGEVQAAWPGGELWNHTREEVAGFFGDLEMVSPGVVAARGWRGGMRDANVQPDRKTYVLGGIGRKLLGGQRDDRAQGAVAAELVPPRLRGALR